MTRYVTLAEYIWLAEQVTGVDAAVLAKSGRIDLADSALHAPAASFGGQEFHPALLSEAAVLTTHLAWNHPQLDGNKRAAWAALVMFIDLDGDQWHPDPPDVDEAEQAMLDVAAHRADEAWLADWLSSRVRFPKPKSHGPEL